MSSPCKRGVVDNIHEQNMYSVNYKEEPKQVLEEQTISRHYWND